ncbi:MAG: hypothetical protein ABI857_06750 [Acidobacteriota bacterium]
MKFDLESFQQLFSNVLRDIMEWLPGLLGAVLLFLIGWIAALVIRFLLGSILRRLGVDKIAEKTGIAPIISSWGFTSSLSRLIARFAFWLILFLFLLAAIESLGLGFVAGAFKSAVTFLPRVLASLLIILLGTLFSGVLGDALGAYADKSGLKSGAFVGTFVKYILFVFVFVIALQQLGVETVLFTSVIIVLLAALLLSLSISFGIGNRELARNISAGFHARESFLPGATLRFRAHEGKLVRIGAFKFIIETSAGQVSLPNHILTEDEIVILVDNAEPDESSE